jgi:hypothetical protein
MSILQYLFILYWYRGITGKKKNFMLQLKIQNFFQYKNIFIEY